MRNAVPAIVSLCLHLVGQFSADSSHTSRNLVVRSAVFWFCN